MAVSPRRGLRPLNITPKRKYKSRALRLSNNNISDLTGIMDLLGYFLSRPSQLGWLDLSFNKLEHVDPVSCLYVSLLIQVGLLVSLLFNTTVFSVLCYMSLVHCNCAMRCINHFSCLNLEIFSCTSTNSTHLFMCSCPRFCARCVNCVFCTFTATASGTCQR